MLLTSLIFVLAASAVEGRVLESVEKRQLGEIQTTDTITMV
jgi:hypothetical protein